MSKIIQGQTAIPDEFYRGQLNDVEEDEESETLTMREREVLQVLRSGSTNIDIANQLFCQ